MHLQGTTEPLLFIFAEFVCPLRFF